MPTRSDPGSDFRRARTALLARADLVGSLLRDALTSLYDGWLASLLPADTSGVALLAVGGLGRREPAPYGDLDLVLLHDGKRSDIAEIADRVWYPIWDCQLGLDHAVRTPQQAIAVAEQDLKAMLGMLDARHLAGDPALTGLLREQVISGWRRTAAGRLAELQELARTRWAGRGDASFLLEPDLKDCRGGLRDWVGLRALASAQLVDLPPAAVRASRTLLDVRGELHRVAGRRTDVLRAQDRDSVAAALGPGVVGSAGSAGDAVLRAVNEAARTLAYATDVGWRRVAAVQPAPRSLLRRLRPGVGPGSARVGSVSARVGPVSARVGSVSARVGPASGRVPLAAEVVLQDGEVVLARDADPWADPGLLLRVARSAAAADRPIAPHALTRLVTECGPLPEPWPAAVRTDFVALLGTGARAVGALEALDQHGLLSRLIPEWEAVRFTAQHNPVHRFTVDRHLVETAVRAGEWTAEVGRPDLLLVGALLHDIGKGRPGDHSVLGAALADRIAARMGFADMDVRLIAGMARHHLLLPDTATRRDLDDPSTVQLVVSAIDGSAELLELLHWLTVADAAATGPAAWSDWKAGLVGQLVRRTRAVLAGGWLPSPSPPSVVALE
ncbi:MAG TPA: [protein-PII] uridylyltransferase, partial [Jatrophihabitans sp.]|nr:[protein-PII] uridylyltransferase [Jatrophihabitans sp.]